MLQILPALAGLAALSSAVLLIVLWRFGETPPATLAVSIAWFLLAAYCQFVAPTMVAATVGLLLQTVLAISLILRWRLGR